MNLTVRTPHEELESLEETLHAIYRDPDVKTIKKIVTDHLTPLKDLGPTVLAWDAYNILSAITGKGMSFPAGPLFSELQVDFFKSNRLGEFTQEQLEEYALLQSESNKDKAAEASRLNYIIKSRDSYPHQVEDAKDALQGSKF